MKISYPPSHFTVKKIGADMQWEVEKDMNTENTVPINKVIDYHTELTLALTTARTTPFSIFWQVDLLGEKMRTASPRNPSQVTKAHW